MDLTHLVPNLNRQLIFALLDFHVASGAASALEATEAKYELFKDSNLAEYALKLCQELGGSESEQRRLATRQGEVVARLEALRAPAERAMAQISQPDIVAHIREDASHNVGVLKARGITPEDTAVLYEYGDMQFSVGNYSVAADYLYHFRILSLDAHKVAKSYWGKLLCEILRANWDAALEDLHALAEHIKATSAHTDPEVVLRERTYWLHASLYVYFAHAQGRDSLVFHWSAPNYMSTIQNNAPWLLRYYVSALVLVRNARAADGAPVPHRLRDQIRDAVRVLVQEHAAYADAATLFLEALLHAVDIGAAGVHLADAAHLLNHDYFLEPHAPAFLAGARGLLADTICRVHDTLSVSAAAEHMQLSPEETAVYFADLFRDSRSFRGSVDGDRILIEHSRPLVRQLVVERTKNLFYRTQSIVSSLAKDE